MNRSWSLSNIPVRRFTRAVSQVVHTAKVGVVLVGMAKRTAILVERVQARTVELEKSASAIRVGAAFGSHFYLRTRIAAVRGGTICTWFSV
jgi:hypothetical protein